MTKHERYWAVQVLVDGEWVWDADDQLYRKKKWATERSNQIRERTGARARVRRVELVDITT